MHACNMSSDASDLEACKGQWPSKDGYRWHLILRSQRSGFTCAGSAPWPACAALTQHHSARRWQEPADRYRSIPRNCAGTPELSPPILAPVALSKCMPELLSPLPTPTVPARPR